MTVLDAQAVLALLKGEPAADEVEGLLRSTTCRLTAVGLAEVLDHLVRIVGVDEETAVLDLVRLGLDGPPPLDAALLQRTGLLQLGTTTVEPDR